MRYLPLLLVLMLTGAFVATGPAQALNLPPGPPGEEAEDPETEPEAESEPEGEPETGEAEPEGEECEWVTEEGESCQEAAEQAEAEECVLKEAAATASASRRSDTVRLTVRYQTFAPSSFVVDATLRGSKGGLHLGMERAPFQLSGAFHDSFDLGRKEMARALAARELVIDLHAVGAPARCRLRLTAHHRSGARRLVWA